MTIRSSIIICFFVLKIVRCNIFEYLSDDYWSTEQIIERNGYPLEVHNITTEDGYILTVQRIPAKNGAAPVLLQHGLLCDSTLWVLLEKENALAFLLANNGYDVWLGNVRGNNYGLHHVNLTTDDDAFWNFTYHEMAIYDLPAMINYIHDSTSKFPLYIGHSQGTTMSYVMAIERPEIAKSIKVFISLAPIAYIGHILDPIIQLIVPFDVYITKIFQFIFNLHAFLPQNYPFKGVFKLWCAFLAVIRINCLNGYALLLGWEHSDMFDLRNIQAAISNFPSGTSYKNIYFYAQHTTNDRFDEYDYGETEDLEIYHVSPPPEYDLTKVFTPVALIYVNGDTDVFVNPLDLEKLQKRLPNIVNEYPVNASGFTHMDFLWGSQAKNYVYNHIIELINKYDD